MTQPLFSILVANYNNGRFFKDCYDSIMLQTYTDWEVIIVDDCSTDDSVTIIKGLIGNDSRFSLFVNEENKGCGYTKKRCAEEAKGGLAGYLDPDDTIMPNALEEIIGMHTKHPDASLVYSNYLLCNEKLQKGVVKKSKYKTSQNYLKTVHNIFPFIGFKTSLYRKTEGISENLKRSVDQDLYYKLEEVGGFVYLDRVLYKYRIHNGGISTKQNRLKARAWQYLVIVDACKRRNENIEDILPAYIANRNYKVGEMVLKPLRYVNSILKRMIK